MLLKNPVQKVFVQLTQSLDLLSDDEYSKPISVLFQASIGQHVRHIIELFLCLEQGYYSGVVSYEKRKRDHTIETNRRLAIELLKDIYHRLERPNVELVIEAEDYDDDGSVIAIPSNYCREVAYNLEHTIHHMALIRIGINEVSSLLLPQEFGVACSTVKYKQQCAR